MEVSRERMKEHLNRIHRYGEMMGYCAEVRQATDEAAGAYDDGYLAGWWKGFARGRRAEKIKRTEVKRDYLF